MTQNLFTPAVVADLQAELNRHPVYQAVQSMDDLRQFMAHHIYSVWDFMSLLKTLQQTCAPTAVPWRPVGDPSVRYFINQIVLGEESDDGLPDASGNPTWASHYELYCDAMREVGADPAPADRFVAVAVEQGIEKALASGIALPAARDFVASSFDFIASGKPHVVAAAFAVGREHIIPAMFRALLAAMAIGKDQAPVFHYYLERHIHLDEDFHGPLSLKLVNQLVGGDAAKLAEAEAAARAAVTARIKFWDGVLAAIKGR